MEWIYPTLGTILRNHADPQNFIDFEVANMVIPVHAGLRREENVAFHRDLMSSWSPNPEKICRIF